MSNFQDLPPVPKNAFNSWKLRMEAKRLEGAEQNPQLAFEYWINNPRISIYLNNTPRGTKGNFLTAKMEIDSMIYFIDSVIDICKRGKAGEKIIIGNKHKWKGDVELPQPEVVNQTIGGLDKEGKCFITVKEDGQPVVPFYFDVNFWYTVSDGEGNAIPEAQQSRGLAISKLRFIRDLYVNVADTHYIQPNPGSYAGKKGNTETKGPNKSNGVSDEFDKMLEDI